MHLEQTHRPGTNGVKLFEFSPQSGDKTQAMLSAHMVSCCSSPHLSPGRSPLVGSPEEAPSAFRRVKSQSFTPAVFSPLPQSASLSQEAERRPFVPSIISKRDSRSPVPFQNGEYIPCESFQNMKITDRFLKTAHGPKALLAATHYLETIKSLTSPEKFLQSIDFQDGRSSQLRFNLSLGTGLAYMVALVQMERDEIFDIQQVNANLILFFTVLKTLVLETADKTIEEILDSELHNFTGLSRKKTDPSSEGIELGDRIQLILVNMEISALEVCGKNSNGHGHTLVALFGKEENYLYDQQNGLYQYESRLALGEDLLMRSAELEDKFETISLQCFAKAKEESKKG